MYYILVGCIKLNYNKQILMDSRIVKVLKVIYNKYLIYLGTNESQLKLFVSSEAINIVAMRRDVPPAKK